MAVAEKEHAALWAGRLRELGEQEPVYRGKTSGDADSLKNRVGGDDLALRRLAILNQVIEDEQDHYRALSGLVRRQKPFGGVRTPTTDPKALLEQMLSKRDQGRAHTAGWI